MKWLLHYFMAFLDLFICSNNYSWREVFIGFLEVVVIAVVFTVSTIFLTWYYAILITICLIILVLLIALLIEHILKSKRK
jgi:hypothetical protein